MRINKLLHSAKTTKFLKQKHINSKLELTKPVQNEPERQDARLPLRLAPKTDTRPKCYAGASVEQQRHLATKTTHYAAVVERQKGTAQTRPYSTLMMGFVGSGCWWRQQTVVALRGFGCWRNLKNISRWNIMLICYFKLNKLRRYKLYRQLTYLKLHVKMNNIKMKVKLQYE